MLLIRVYDQWRGISFLGDNFSAVLRGRKLYVIILVRLGSAFMGMCRRVLVDNFYFWYFVESVIACHEGSDALAKVTDLDADIPEEGAAYPSSHDHDCLRVHLGQI